MPTDLKLRVSALIDEAGRIERESETVYLELGRIFPRLSDEMQRGADNGERSMQALQGIELMDRSRSRGPGRVSVRDSFVQEASSYFASLRERDASLLARINEGIARLGDLEQIIARVRADSEEMEIISLNAMTVALKSGSQGKAFSVITDELKRLSGRTISLTEGVTASGRSLLDYFAKLRNILAELGDFQREFFSMIDSTLGSGFAETERELRGATAFFTALLAEARSVKEPVLRVMGEVQLQDIVRQSLQHVGLSLQEALHSADSADSAEVAFVAAVAELTGNLIEDIVGKLDSSASSFGSDMDAVSSIVNESERKRLGYLETRVGRTAGAELGSFKTGSERYLELKRAIVAMASRLTDHVAGLDGSFKGLASLLSRFQNIVVASRIEVAKTKALAGVATTVGGMISLTDRIEGDVNAAMDTPQDFTRLAGEALGGYSVEGDLESDRLVSTLSRVEEDLGRLSQAKESLQGSIAGFTLYTPDFIALIAQAAEELAKLGSLAERLRSIGSNLDELKSTLRATLGPESEGIESERMRQMVERFTIFTHKKAGGTIGRFAVEDGSEAGEVTLF
jgi:hypothetical protein